MRINVRNEIEDMKNYHSVYLVITLSSTRIYCTVHLYLLYGTLIFTVR